MNKIKNIKREDLFKVPNGFFEELESDILSKTIGREKILPFYKNNWIQSIAASLIIGISIIVYWNVKTVPIPENRLAEITNLEILNYLEDESATNALYDYAENHNIELENTSLNIKITSDDLIDDLDDIDLENLTI